MDVWKQASTLVHPFLSIEFVEMVEAMMKDNFIPGSETWVYEEDGQIKGFIGMQKNEIGGLLCFTTIPFQGHWTKTGSVYPDAIQRFRS
ncbi:MAG: putative acetyltransferase [Crocinitomicaceae bacterium]|jgi:putative acetyltransferase